MEINPLTIELSDDLKKFVDEQVASGRSTSAGEFIRQLLDKEKKQQARGKVEALLEEGLASGPPVPMTNDDWELIHQSVRDYLAGRAKT